MSLLTGTKVGRYEIRLQLGAGGMGEVYLARDSQLDRDVALKILPADAVANSEQMRRFVQEAKAASALNHPNIVTIHEIGDGEAGRFIVMEYIAGHTLRALMDQGLPLDAFVSLGSQIAKALSVAHANGITHRDIKPDNVMVRTDGIVKLLDFGVARLIPGNAALSEAETLARTSPGLLVGTARYMSPEQARGEKVSQASDIFSLGLVFYEMVTGQRPFVADSVIGSLHAIMTQTPLPPSRVSPGISAGLDALIMRMLEKDWRLRPTATEVDRALTELQSQTTNVETSAAVLTPRWRHSVGRENELTELHASFAAVAAGRGLIWCITGEPGIGKTTLVEDFLNELAVDGEACAIARGRCSERLAGTEAYLPLLEALDSLMHVAGGESASRMMKLLAPTWYVQIAPLAADDPSASRLMADVKVASQERMKRELSAFLQAESRLRPLVLFFDDLHWADVSTVDMLAYLAAKFEGMRLLIVITYRSSEMLLAKHPFLQVKLDLQARGVCREIPLEFLSREDVEKYLALEFPEHSFPAELPALIHSKTEGSPLFMVDLVRYLHDRKVIAEKQGRWVLAQAVPDIKRELPESVRSMIQRKTDQLSETDRKLLVAASVQGYKFDSAVVSKALSMDAVEAEERLEVLDRVHGFVGRVKEHEFPDRTITLRCQFVHVLYQNALYASLTPTRRASLSAAVAQALLDHYGEQASVVANELAVLFAAARDFQRATHYFVVAAEHALEIFANREAALLARRGIEQLEMLPAGPERIQQELTLQLTLGLALRNAIGFGADEVGKAYGRARELCELVGQTAQLFPVLHGLWEFYEVHASYTIAVGLADQCLRLAQKADDPELLQIAHDISGDTHLWLGDFLLAREHLEQGIALYDQERYQSHNLLYGYDTGMSSLASLAIALWQLGYPDQALGKADDALRVAQRASHPFTLACAQAFAAWVHQLRRDGKAAQQCAEAGIAFSREHGIQFFETWGEIVRGWALAEQGKTEEGINALRQALSVWQAIGSEHSRPFGLALLAESHGRVGQTEEGLALLAEAMDLVAKTGERFYEAELYRLKGELLLRSKDHGTQSEDQKEAEQCFIRAIEIGRKQSAKSLELRAAISLSRLYQQQGKSDEAHRMLAEIYNWFTEGFDTANLKEARALLGKQ